MPCPEPTVRVGDNPRWPDVWALALLVAAIVAYFLPWLTLQKVFFQVDIAFMDHPLRVHAFRMIRSGHFPFWTDHLLCGFPLFAEGQAAILYPPSWLYLVLSPDAALNTFVVFHFLLLGTSSYVFLRSRPLSPFSSLFGSLTLVFSSFVLVQHILLGFLSVLAWLPLLLWLANSYVRHARVRSVLTAAVVVATMHLAGDALGTTLALVLFAGHTAFVTETTRPGVWRRRMIAVALPLLLGTLLAGAQLVPTYEFLGQSTRSAGIGVSEDQFVPARYLLTALSPRFFGDAATGYLGPRHPGWEESLLFFCGWTPLLVVPFALRRGRAMVFWAAVSLLGVALSVRTLAPLSKHVWSLPLLDLFRWPTHALLWYAFGLSFLAAYGCERAVAIATLPRRVVMTRVLVVAAAGVAALIGLLGARSGWLTPLPQGLSAGQVLRMRHDDVVGFLVVWLTLLAVAALVRARRIARWTLMATLLLGLAAGTLVSQRPLGISGDIYRAVPATARFLQDRLGPTGRILSAAPWSFPTDAVDDGSMRIRLARIPDNVHLLFGLRSVGQFDLASTTTLRRNGGQLLYPNPRVLELLAVDAIVVPTSLLRPATPQDAAAPPPGPEIQSWLAAGWLGRDYFACYNGEPKIYCRKDRPKRAFLAHDYEVVESEGAAMGYVRERSPDLRRLVILEKHPVWTETTATDGVDVDRLHFTRDEPGDVELEIEALLVLADTYYTGWRAFIDGQPGPVLAANGFVRAVAVPAGRHRVAFRYDARSVRAGSLVSAAGAFGIAACGLCGAIRRRTPRSDKGAPFSA
jgi:hypothetical protein